MFETPLATAALQFVAAHPQIVSVIPGGQSPAEVSDNSARFVDSVPLGLWEALKREGLIDITAPTPVRTVEAAC
jgi:D-threo-aldose 1-dehydrogenase